MFSIYNDERASSKGRGYSSSYKILEQLLKNNYKLVESRMGSSAKALKPNHILVKLLNGLGLRRNMDLDDIQFLTMDMMYKLGASLHLTTSSTYGRPMYDQFLTGVAETIILTDSEFDHSVEWQALTPIEFIYHPHTNMNFVLGVDGANEGVAYIKINLPMLAYQYVKWAAWRKANDVEENTYQFLAKVPFINAMPSYIDVALFNRFYYNLLDRPILSDDRNPHVYLPDIESKIFDYVIKTLDILFSRRLSISQYTYSVQLMWHDSVFDLTKPLRVIHTQQVEWAMLLSQLPFIHFGLLLAYLNDSRVDSGTKSTIYREIKAMQQTHIFDKQPSAVSTYNIDTFVEPVKDLLM